MKTEEYRYQLGRKLAEIREEYTDMNQEEFYAAYLKGHDCKKLNTGASYQNFMKLLENGCIDCPASYIPIYARIANISVSDLLNVCPADQNEIGSPKQLTYSDCASVILKLIDNESLSFRKYRNQYGEECLSLIVNDEVLKYIFNTYDKFRDLLITGSITKQMYVSMDKKIQADFNGRILDQDVYMSDDLKRFNSRKGFPGRENIINAYHYAISNK